MRLGIYGGTFSPPHMGHISAAKAFVDTIQLDKLLIIPTYIPPHKSADDVSSPGDRLEMCRLAFSQIPKAEISDIEIRRRGKSYTYLTLEELHKEEIELFLLCGTDMFLSLDTWVNFRRIFELATICYIRRENDTENDVAVNGKISEYQTRYNAKIIEVDHSVIELSSTDIRKALTNRRDTTKMLDHKTLSYITEKGLYK